MAQFSWLGWRNVNASKYISESGIWLTLAIQRLNSIVSIWNMWNKNWKTVSWISYKYNDSQYTARTKINIEDEKTKAKWVKNDGKTRNLNEMNRPHTKPIRTKCLVCSTATDTAANAAMHMHTAHGPTTSMETATMRLRYCKIRAIETNECESWSTEEENENDQRRGVVCLLSTDEWKSLESILSPAPLFRLSLYSITANGFTGCFFFAFRPVQFGHTQNSHVNSWMNYM